MSTEDSINQLYEELDVLESRISQLEGNNTQRGGYFKNIIEQIEEPKCCDPCGNGNGGSGGDNGGENPSVISCDGATPWAHFLTTPETYRKQWSVELDGIIYDLAFNVILTNYYMPQEVRDVLRIGGDGDWFIENRTSDIHRVRFIPEENSLPVSSPDIDLPSNPTIHIDEDTGIISFCLAASTGEIPAV